MHDSPRLYISSGAHSLDLQNYPMRFPVFNEVTGLIIPFLNASSDIHYVLFKHPSIAVKVGDLDNEVFLADINTIFID